MMIGVVFTLAGFLGLLASLYLKIGNEAVIASSGLMTLGSGLFSKERFQQSERAAQLYSKRPPGYDTTGIVYGVGLPLPLFLHKGQGKGNVLAFKCSWVDGAAWLVVLAFLLGGAVGCAGTQEAVDTVRKVTTGLEPEAEQLRERFAVIEVQYAGIAPLVQTICVWRGANTVECATLEGIKRAIDDGIPRVKAALSIAEQSRVTLAAALLAVEGVELTARAFRADVERAREGLHAALAQLVRGPAEPPPAVPVEAVP
jgi:hypothetical protein